MLLKVENVYTRVFGTPAEKSWLEQVLCVQQKHYNPYQKQMVISVRHFLQGGAFRTGLLQTVKDLAEEDEIELCIQDTRCLIPVEIPVLDSLLEGVVLRPEQVIAAQTLIQEQRGIIEAPPGSGKTESLIAALKVLPPCVKFAIFVNNRDLLKQWIYRLVKRGFPEEEIGSIHPARWDVKRLTVALMPTIRARLGTRIVDDFLLSLYGFAVDEVHVAGCETYENPLSQTENSVLRWGLSATPFGKDEVRNKTITGLIGDVVFLKTLEESIEDETISDFIYYFLPVLCLGVNGDEDFHTQYKSHLHSSPFVASLLNLILRKHTTEQCLIIVNRIQHGEYLQRSIPGSTFVHGQLLQTKREEILQEYRDKKIRVLITSPILDFGIDIQDIEVLVLAGGLESLIRLIQRIGRGLRKKLGKILHVYDLDFGDVPYLGDHSKTRLKIVLKKCPKVKVLRTL
jgi:superfamily II DNA or RNA helicase